MGQDWTITSCPILSQSALRSEYAVRTAREATNLHFRGRGSTCCAVSNVGSATPGFLERKVCVQKSNLRINFLVQPVKTLLRTTRLVSLADSRKVIRSLCPFSGFRRIRKMSFWDADTAVLNRPRDLSWLGTLYAPSLGDPCVKSRQYQPRASGLRGQCAKTQ